MSNPDTPPLGVPAYGTPEFNGRHRPKQHHPWRTGGLVLALALIAGVGFYVGGPYLAAHPPKGKAAETNRKAKDTEPKVLTYLCEDQSTGLLLQWERAPHSFAGTVDMAELTGNPPNQSVNSSTDSFHGHLDGQAITITFGTTDIYGKLTARKLTLNLPTPDGSIQPMGCSAATVGDWNTMVSGFHTTAGSNNSAANQQIAEQQQNAQITQDQQQLSSDIIGLAQDAATLDNNNVIASDLSTLKNDLSVEESDYNTEVNSGCSYDSSQVDSDYSQLQSDDTQLQSDDQSLQSYEQTVQGDISTVNTDLSALTNLGIAPSTSPSAALQAGAKAISDTNNAITYGNEQASPILTQGEKVDNTADAYTNTNGCG